MARAKIYPVKSKLQLALSILWSLGGTITRTKPPHFGGPTVVSFSLQMSLLKNSENPFSEKQHSIENVVYDNKEGEKWVCNIHIFVFHELHLSLSLF